jgi:hypothetical protein
MKKNYILIPLITLLCTNAGICFGQKSSAIEIKSLSFTILDVVHGINSKLDSFYTTEKSDGLKKNLAAFKIDIEDYQAARNGLLLYLGQDKYNVSTKIAQVKIANLQNRMEILLSRMILVSALVNNEYYQNANYIYGAVMYNEQPIRSVTMLQDLIDGKKVDIKLLKASREIISDELKLSILMITQVEYKIKVKAAKRIG